MSEYMEKHSVARLIGSPPGYGGFDEGGQLTEAVRRRPWAVVLFDEIEKAHHDVFNVLLQILDDGRLTDGHGRTVDFRNVVVILTSNIGSTYLQEGRTESEPDTRRRVLEALRHELRPELLNRIDDVVVFRSLGRPELARIVDIQMARLSRLLTDRQLELELTPAARELLGEAGWDPQFGARPLKRAIQRELLDPLALQVLRGEFKPGDRVVADAQDGRLAFAKVLYDEARAPRGGAEATLH
jgi:ATP-dependent Clp protease ATP-binding subunit ClpB